MEIKQELEHIRGTVVFNVLIGSDEESTPMSKSFLNLRELIHTLTNGAKDIEQMYDSATAKVERVIFSGKTDTGTDLSLLVNLENMSGHVKPVIHQAELDLSILEEVEKIHKISKNIIEKTKNNWEL